MKNIATVVALCTLIVLPVGCKKKGEGSTPPDEAAESDQDPLAELEGIPVAIQGEVDMVLQPITDVDVVIDQLTSLPTKYGLDATTLTGMAKASLDGGEVSIEIDVTAEAKAEIETLLGTVKGIAVGIKELPQRSKTAAENIVALGAKGTGIAAKLQTQYQGKLANPLLKADKKAEMEAELATVVRVNGEIKGTVDDAKATVMGVPALGTKALAKLTAALAGGGGAGAGGETE